MKSSSLPFFDIDIIVGLNIVATLAFYLEYKTLYLLKIIRKIKRIFDRVETKRMSSVIEYVNTLTECSDRSSLISDLTNDI